MKGPARRGRNHATPVAADAPGRACLCPEGPPSQGRQGNGAVGLARSPDQTPRSPWAELLQHVFLEDVLACPCGGRRRVIAFITERTVVKAILEQLGLRRPDRRSRRPAARPRRTGLHGKTTCPRCSRRSAEGRAGARSLVPLADRARDGGSLSWSSPNAPSGSSSSAHATIFWRTSIAILSSWRAERPCLSKGERLRASLRGRCVARPRAGLLRLVSAGRKR